MRELAEHLRIVTPGIDRRLQRSDRRRLAIELNAKTPQRAKGTDPTRVRFQAELVGTLGTPAETERDEDVALLLEQVRVIGVFAQAALEDRAGALFFAELGQRVSRFQASLSICLARFDEDLIPVARGPIPLATLRCRHRCSQDVIRARRVGVRFACSTSREDQDRAQRQGSAHPA